MTTSRSDILVVTSETVPGREIAQALGIVRGSTVRTKHIGSDIVASMRSIVGGEVKEYAALLAGAREQAFDRMVEEAARLGADAIVTVRFESSTIQESASEVLAYGTAVRLR